MTGFPVAQAWMFALPLQQQSVLLLACRFADGARKDHPLKPLQRAYRACVLNAARYGRPMRFGERGDGFMELPAEIEQMPETAAQQWPAIFADCVDDLPHHYLQHLAHGAEILGYKHPDPRLRVFWWHVYEGLIASYHMRPESETDLDWRLGDWGRKHWDVTP